MYILSADGRKIFDASYIQRITLSVQDDTVMIKAGYGSEAATLGRYADDAEAKAAMSELFAALTGGQDSFIMPDSLLNYEQPKIKDARHKRRGGS